MKASRLLLILPFILLGFQLWTGEAHIDWTHPMDSPVFLLRLYRGIGGFLIGGALALAGLCCQILFRNPLATPSTLGVSSGGAVGASAMFLFCSGPLLYALVPAGAFLGALLALGLVFLLGHGGRRTTESLLLAGVITGTILSSVLVYLISIANSRELANVTWWTLGDLQALPPYGLLLLALLSMPILWYLRRQANALNAMVLGEEKAISLGVNVPRLRLLLPIMAALLASAAVSMAGIIGFIGLIVPHLSRHLWGCDHRRLLLRTYIGGGIFLQLCDFLGKLTSGARQVPVGVLTACVGGGLFLILVNQKKS